MTDTQAPGWRHPRRHAARSVESRSAAEMMNLMTLDEVIRTYGMDGDELTDLMLWVRAGLDQWRGASVARCRPAHRRRRRQPLHPGRPTEEDPCGGVAHFDGTTWTSYLADSCIEDFAIAPDGSVWLGAAAGNRLHVYVITPEAVAPTRVHRRDSAPSTYAWWTSKDRGPSREGRASARVGGGSRHVEDGGGMAAFMTSAS